MPREQIARSTEPRQESHRRRSVEPGNVRAASEHTVGGASSRVVRAMEWQGDLEREMGGDRGAQKRTNAQQEGHEDTEENKIRRAQGDVRGPSWHLVEL